MTTPVQTERTQTRPGPAAASRPAELHTADGRRLLTGADLAALPTLTPTGSVRYELYDGELRVMSPTSFGHGASESAINNLLRVRGEHPGFGKVACGEVGLQLASSPDTVVGADAVFLTADQLPPKLTAEGWLETRPALVVEVLSKNDRPHAVRDKVRRYRSAGVPRVLVIDPRKRQVTLHREHAQSLVVGGNELLDLSDMIPGFVVPVRDLFD